MPDRPGSRRGPGRFPLLVAWAARWSGSGGGGGGPVEVGLGLGPVVDADDFAEPAAVHVTGLEVDATPAPRPACLVGRVGERLPGQDHVPGRGDAGLDLRAAGRDGDLGVEVVGPEEVDQDSAAGGAERAVPGHVLGERWGDHVECLVGLPILAEDVAEALAGPEPRGDLLVLVALPDAGDRPHEVVLG